MLTFWEIFNEVRKVTYSLLSNFSAKEKNVTNEKQLQLACHVYSNMADFLEFPRRETSYDMYTYACHLGKRFFALERCRLHQVEKSFPIGYNVTLK